jgi:hypothetical protein
MKAARTTVGTSLPSILLEWWLLIVFVPDGPDFPHDSLGLQVVDVGIPTLIAALLVASCWRLMRAPGAEASTASVVSLFAVACLFFVLALGPISSGWFKWWIALNIALASYLAVLGTREFVRIRRTTSEQQATIEEVAGSA